MPIIVIITLRFRVTDYLGKSQGGKEEEKIVLVSGTLGLGKEGQAGGLGSGRQSRLQEGVSMFQTTQCACKLLLPLISAQGCRSSLSSPAV